MITHAYDNLSKHREADTQAQVTAAVDAFAAIAVAMEAGEEHGPPELYPCYALLQQEAIEGLADLRTPGDETGSTGPATPVGDVHVAVTTEFVPDLAEVARLGGLVCEVLLRAAPGIPDPEPKLALINAAAHAARIRDLVAP